MSSLYNCNLCILFFTTEWIFNPARIVLNHTWYQYSPCILRFIKKLNQLNTIKRLQLHRDRLSISKKRWYRKLGCLLKKQSPRNLFELVSSLNLRNFIRNSDTKHVFFKKHFFTLTMKEWKKFQTWKAKKKKKRRKKKNFKTAMNQGKYSVDHFHNPKRIINQ